MLCRNIKLLFSRSLLLFRLISKQWEEGENSERWETLLFQLVQLFRSCTATGESQACALFRFASLRVFEFKLSDLQGFRATRLHSLGTPRRVWYTWLDSLIRYVVASTTVFFVYHIMMNIALIRHVEAHVVKWIKHLPFFFFSNQMQRFMPLQAISLN